MKPCSSPARKALVPRLALVYRAPVTRQEAERAAEMLMEGSSFDLHVVVHDGDANLDSIEVSGDHNGLILCLMAGADLMESMRQLQEALEELASEADRFQSLQASPTTSADLSRLVEQIASEPARPPSRAARRRQAAGITHPGSTPHRLSSRKGWR